MKQKYIVQKDTEQQEFIIQEFAELDKDMMSMVCEEHYGFDLILENLQKSKQAVIIAMRTHNMYPPTAYMDKLANTLIRMVQSDEADTEELLFDDADLFRKEKEEVTSDAVDEIEDEEGDIDELLEDEIDDDFGEENPINTIKSNIKLTGDDSLNIEEDD